MYLHVHAIRLGNTKRLLLKHLLKTMRSILQDTGDIYTSLLQLLRSKYPDSRPCHCEKKKMIENSLREIEKPSPCEGGRVSRTV